MKVKLVEIFAQKYLILFTGMKKNFRFALVSILDMSNVRVKTHTKLSVRSQWKIFWSKAIMLFKRLEVWKLRLQIIEKMMMR